MIRKKELTKQDRDKIEKAYKELEQVRGMLKMIYLAKSEEDNKYLDSLNAEENRLLRYIENIKGLNEPNMN